MSIFNKYVAPYNKEVVTLLESSLDPDTKMYFLKSSMNNLSKSFTKSLNLQSKVSDRCSVETSRGLYTVCLTTSLTSLSCRQFYKGLSGFYCYCIFSDRMYRVDSCSILIDGKCGTGNETTPAKTVQVSIKDATYLTMEQFEEEVYV
jgi:hypothetical protein